MATRKKKAAPAAKLEEAHQAFTIESPMGNKFRMGNMYLSTNVNLPDVVVPAVTGANFVLRLQLVDGSKNVKGAVGVAMPLVMLDTPKGCTTNHQRDSILMHLINAFGLPWSHVDDRIAILNQIGQGLKTRPDIWTIEQHDAWKEAKRLGNPLPGRRLTVNPNLPETIAPTES